MINNKKTSFKGDKKMEYIIELLKKNKQSYIKKKYFKGFSNNCWTSSFHKSVGFKTKSSAVAEFVCFKSSYHDRLVVRKRKRIMVKIWITRNKNDTNQHVDIWKNKPYKIEKDNKIIFCQPYDIIPPKKIIPEGFFGGNDFESFFGYIPEEGTCVERKLKLK